MYTTKPDPQSYKEYNKQKTCGKTKIQTLYKQKITLQIRTLLWNATIRATLTYGLQTMTLTEEQYNKLEKFTFNCHREMIEPNWILQLKDNKHISQEQVNEKMAQPSIKTWLRKLRLTHHAKQTKTSWMTHTQENDTILETEQIWNKEWETTQQALQQTKNNKTNTTRNNQNTYLFQHKSKKQQKQK